MIGVFMWSMLDQPNFDDHDPQYAAYVQTFEKARLVDSRGVSTPTPLDLDGLNRGDWVKACLFGGYTNPSEKMIAFGATLNPLDVTRWADARRQGFRLAEVEEYEVAIAYIDRANQAHFIHFRRGIGSNGQHLEACVSRPETEIAL